MTICPQSGLKFMTFACGGHQDDVRDDHATCLFDHVS